ncbi:MAG: thermonuclease family protein [Synechococcus sp. SP2 MAG]|nr:thermonuclease family protein [Synechococcus sp. SP2 MAG]
MVKLLFLVIFMLLAQARVGGASDQRLPLVRFQGCYDGDTCTTTDAEKVRLACIDAPEKTRRSRFRATRMSPISYDNSLFERSANHLRALVSGRMVGIRRISTDRYGRTVAELFVDNKNVGQLQVMSGHAVISRKYAWQCAWSLSL